MVGEPRARSSSRSRRALGLPKRSSSRGRPERLAVCSRHSSSPSAHRVPQIDPDRLAPPARWRSDERSPSARHPLQRLGGSAPRAKTLVGEHASSRRRPLRQGESSASGPNWSASRSTGCAKPSRSSPAHLRTGVPPANASHSGCAASAFISAAHRTRWRCAPSRARLARSGEALTPRAGTSATARAALGYRVWRTFSAGRRSRSRPDRPFDAGRAGSWSGSRPGRRANRWNGFEESARSLADLECALRHLLASTGAWATRWRTPGRDRRRSGSELARASRSSISSPRPRRR